MSSYTLTYFPGRGGAEICRLTLAAAGIEYTDERIAGEDWQKRRPGTPMKAMPIFTVKNKEGKETIYCQSGAICRYFAKENGLMGSTKAENFLVEEVFDSVTDTVREFYKFAFEKDETKKAELKKTFVDTAFPKFVDYFNLRSKGYGKDGYIIGDKLSLADIAVFNMVDGLTLRGHGEYLKDCESLQKHYQCIKTNPKIAGWLEKRPKSDF